MNSYFQTLKSDDGFEFRAFVSKPASETAPGLVLLQEEFGINKQIHNTCDLLADYAFASPESPSYNKPAASMAYSRSFAVLQRALGPDFDLSVLWERHLECEFVDRDVESNMKTMVAQPYVNSIPTMTGGVGYNELYNFYKHHFLHVNPRDTRMIPISRTIGADRIVDEMIFCFTHDREIDWMLPGVAPTGNYVEVPLVAIVCFRGGKLYNEHIYWDQASVLVQIGLIVAARRPACHRHRGHAEAHQRATAIESADEELSLPTARRASLPGRGRAHKIRLVANRMRAWFKVG